MSCWGFEGLTEHIQYQHTLLTLTLNVVYNFCHNPGYLSPISFQQILQGTSKDLVSIAFWQEKES